MYGQNIQHSEPIILLLLVCIVALATLAKRFETPYPIVLVVAGLFLSLIPRVPECRSHKPRPTFRDVHHLRQRRARERHLRGVEWWSWRTSRISGG